MQPCPPSLGVNELDKTSSELPTCREGLHWVIQHSWDVCLDQLWPAVNHDGFRVCQAPETLRAAWMTGLEFKQQDRAEIHTETSVSTGLGTTKRQILAEEKENISKLLCAEAKYDILEVEYTEIVDRHHTAFELLCNLHAQSLVRAENTRTQTVSCAIGDVDSLVKVFIGHEQSNWCKHYNMLSVIQPLWSESWKTYIRGWQCPCRA
jgi:hypothetical protein